MLSYAEYEISVRGRPTKNCHRSDIIKHYIILFDSIIPEQQTFQWYFYLFFFFTLKEKGFFLPRVLWIFELFEILLCRTKEHRIYIYIYNTYLCTYDNLKVITYGYPWNNHVKNERKM